MIRARTAALASLPGKHILRYAQGSFNTVVLPADDDTRTIHFYLLTPQERMESVPSGGHARIDVSEDGKAAPPHAEAS